MQKSVFTKPIFHNNTFILGKNLSFSKQNSELFENGEDEPAIFLVFSWILHIRVDMVVDK